MKEERIIQRREDQVQDQDHQEKEKKGQDQIVQKTEQKKVQRKRIHKRKRIKFIRPIFQLQFLFDFFLKEHKYEVKIQEIFQIFYCYIQQS
jgi:hypothetical protein